MFDPSGATHALTCTSPFCLLALDCDVLRGMSAITCVPDGRISASRVRTIPNLEAQRNVILHSRKSMKCRRGVVHA